MTCVFCDSDQVKERLAYENDFARAFLTNQPIVPGHTLVIPKRHAETLFELSDIERNNLFEAAQKVMGALTLSFGAHGFNFAWNQGVKAGQSVPHVHLHIVPRTEGDAGIIEYEPRSFLYRPGSRAESSQEELHQIAAQIKKAL